MVAYLPIIISAIIIFTALMWWLLALGSVTKNVSARKAVDAPPVAAAISPKVAAQPTTPVTAAPLMTAPAPAKKQTVKAESKPKAAPPKAATPKAVAAKVAAKPAAKKASAPAKAPAKPTSAKVAAAKTAPAKTAVAPKAAAKPKTVAAAKPKTATKPKAAAKSVIPDNLELLKGVGPKLNTLLKSLGVTSFEQVASWSASDVTEIDAKLGTFAGRIGRDNWIDQAKLLVAGDVAGFEKKYGALGSEVAKS